MNSNEACPVCGFQWSSLSRDQVPTRLKAATDSFAGVVVASRARVGVRPTPERWSILEYGAHLRDVLLSIRDRIIAASIIDEPIGSPIYRDERVDLGFYSLDTADDVANELAVASRLFTKTFASLPDGYERREFFYSPITPTKVTILWAGAQAVHESEHHLSDVQENVRLV